jgi:hypothetical protein
MRQYEVQRQLECKRRVLGAEKRTRANVSELRRMRCRYPLRFDQKRVLSNTLVAGKIAGNFGAGFLTR